MRNNSQETPFHWAWVRSAARLALIFGVALAPAGCAFEVADESAPAEDELDELPEAETEIGGAYYNTTCFCGAYKTKYCENLLTGKYFISCSTHESSTCGC